MEHNEILQYLKRELNVLEPRAGLLENIQKRCDVLDATQSKSFKTSATTRSKNPWKLFVSRVAVIACAVLILTLGVYFTKGLISSPPVSLAAPANLQINGNVLTWDAEPKATFYIVDIDGMTTQTVRTRYTIPSELEQIERIRIKAGGENIESEWAYESDYNIVRYKVSVITGIGGSANSTVGYYAGNATVTLSVTPDFVYGFEGWYDQSISKISEDLTYTFEMPKSSLAFEARFVSVKDLAVAVNAVQNNTRDDSSGIKLSSNSNSEDFPGVYFLWDATKKDSGYLKVASYVFEKYSSFVITTKEANTYWDYTIKIHDGQKMTDDGYYVFFITNAQNNKSINMVFIPEYIAKIAFIPKK